MSSSFRLAFLFAAPSLLAGAFLLPALGETRRVQAERAQLEQRLQAAGDLRRLAAEVAGLRAEAQAHGRERPAPPSPAEQALRAVELAAACGLRLERDAPGESVAAERPPRRWELRGEFAGLQRFLAGLARFPGGVHVRSLDVERLPAEDAPGLPLRIALELAW